MPKRKPNPPKQPDLFGHNGIKEHHLKQLRALRDEFAQRAKDNEHKRKVLEHTRKAEAQDEWTHFSKSCTRLK
jgi:hypothetical protein